MARTRYLIIGYPRSGTTVIHLLLKGHPNVAALNDVLRVSPFFTKGISTFTFGNDLKEEKTLGFSGLFDAITSISADGNTTAFGAKCGCFSTDQAQTLVSTLQNRLTKLKIILMIRNDVVAQYGSAQNAKITGIYHSFNKGFEDFKIHKLKIRKWLFVRYATNYLDTLRILRSLHKTHDVMECVYEDFVFAPEAVYKQLIDFVQVPYAEITRLNSKKILPNPEEYIVNYPEMTNLLDDLRSKHVSNTIPPLIRTLIKVASSFLSITPFGLKKRSLNIKRQ